MRITIGNLGKTNLRTPQRNPVESFNEPRNPAPGSGFLPGFSIFLVALFLAAGTAKGESSQEIEVTKTSPAYAEEVNNLKGLEITIEFNQPMDPTIEEDVLLDQRGATDEEGNPIEIPGKISWRDPKTMEIRISQTLTPYSTYQVSLFSVRSKSGMESEQVPFRTVFTTGPGN